MEWLGFRVQELEGWSDGVVEWWELCSRSRPVRLLTDEAGSVGFIPGLGVQVLLRKPERRLDPLIASYGLTARGIWRSIPSEFIQTDSPAG